MTSADPSAGDWDNESGTPRYLGEPAGFVVELEDGGRLYHAGDTNVFGDRLIGELYHPDVAFLPIGGHYTMGPREAALAVELLGVREVPRSTTAPSRSCAGRRTAPLGARRAWPRRRHRPRPGARRIDRSLRMGAEARPAPSTRGSRSARDDQVGVLMALSGRNARCTHASEVACTPTAA